MGCLVPSIILALPDAIAVSSWDDGEEDCVGDDVDCGVCSGVLMLGLGGSLILHIGAARCYCREISRSCEP